MATSIDHFITAIEERKQQQRLRKLRKFVPLNAIEVLIDGQRCINFGSNDYLGLSQHPYLKERAIQFISSWGVGSPASRLLCGNNEVYEKIEDQLAKLKGSEAALIFPTGFQLNLSIFFALSRLAKLFICDRLSHNSLLLGAKFSGSKFTRFAHNDLNDLQAKLLAKQSEGLYSWIITESVFSMDGDLGNLEGLSQISKEHGAQLFVDEAHATGVFGKNGMGLACDKKDISLVMGTFGKGCGSFGAYVACSSVLKEYLINFCPGFIYTTALPPAVLGAIDAALEMIPSMDNERKHLSCLANYFRNAISTLGLDIGRSESQIIPLILKDDTKVIALTQHLEKNSIFAPVIRPPTVPEGEARIRFSLSALHTEQHIDKLFKVIKDWHDTTP